VVESAPTTNYGSSTSLEVDGDPTAKIQSYVRFTVSGIGLPISSAILRLHVTGNGGTDGPWVLPANNNWKESAITWATSPPTWSHPTADLGAAPANTWVSFDVTSLVTKNGQYTFKLATASVDGIEFSSRETLQPPQLLINLATPVASTPPTASTPTPTRTATPAAPTATATPTVTSKSTPSPTPKPSPSQPVMSANPFDGAKFYIDPASPARTQANAWRSTRPSDAAEMDKIAGQPEADWIDSGSGDIATAIDRRVSTISAAGALPVLVAYNIPKRDCVGSGASSTLAYQTWIRAFAAAIGSREAIVILEPDALANIGCLSAAEQTTRLALIKDAVSVLEAQPGVSVYVDAGHSNWVSASTMAGLLTKAGIDQAQGFALNVASFGTTSDNIAYGRDLSARVGGKHFIIDTSRNGLGPAPDAQWCNPPGRALGPAPTAATGDPLVDAFFWIKRPGESDGTCNGGPVAGLWWADYALGLAERAP
jgi:endoglucanase